MSPEFGGGGALERLTASEVDRCAREAEVLFQQDPHAMPARNAAAWARLAAAMRDSGCEAVGALGPAAVHEWKRELGFSTERAVGDSDWPRARDSIRDGRSGGRPG